jgi:Fic family protein
MDITLWMEWFLGCLGRAIARAHDEFGAVFAKAKFWDSVRSAPLKERQRLLRNRLLDGFEGKLTTAKWAKLAKCSHDTALRDIQDLLKRGILVQNPGGGRSASYSLATLS